MSRSILSSFAFMAILTGTAIAADRADPFVNSLMEDNTAMRVKLEKAELIKRHLEQVIKILKDMPNGTRDLLSLDKMELNDEGRIDLSPVAQADLKAGRVNFLLAGGLAHPATEAFQKRMRQKYGIHYLDFGLGCTTEPFIRKSVEEHNALVTQFLHKKYPKYGVEKEKAWEASVAEQGKNISSPITPTR
jgi:hypothetical protein